MEKEHTKSTVKKFQNPLITSITRLGKIWRIAVHVYLNPMMKRDNLIRKSVSCTDCGVGWFKTYYKNGNLELTGEYKENPTGNWDDIWDRGYCSVPDGKWTYFKENGDTLYSEFWDNGVFVKQVPEQTKVEIWDIEIQLNGKDADTLSIPIVNIGDLIIKPKYKNSTTNSERYIRFKD
jgi:hypothetical protein